MRTSLPAVPERSSGLTALRAVTARPTLSFIAMTWLLVRADCYKLTRRRWFLLGTLALLFCSVAMVVWPRSNEATIAASWPLELYHDPVPCSYYQTTPTPTFQCLDRKLTSAEVAQLRAIKRARVEDLAQGLRLPSILQLAVALCIYLGTLLLVVIASFLMGNDYETGYVRLLFSRGARRSQFLLARLAMILILAVCIIVAIALLTIIAGLLVLALVLPAYGGSVPGLTGSQLTAVLLYLLGALFPLIIYALFGACAAIIGQSTAVGVATGLGWWIVNLLIGLLDIQLRRTNTGGFLRLLCDYSLQLNQQALIQHQEHLLFGGPSASIPLARALLVLGIYIVAPIVVAAWISQRRDVTA